ncbi:hypothetical protein DASB73_000010 [Starmerella bacillaris]|uniref:PA14 domain-containing protein n=1 Tax=Starmerella bacillaris TaxID=1247836 RepID=A0AAV5RD18_STABA|nr:hypothetical protein DASB73_000010 [Starmerella bacillaris]
MISMIYLFLIARLWVTPTLAAGTCQCEPPSLAQRGWEIDYYPYPRQVNANNNTFYVNGFTQYGPAYAHQSGYTSSINYPNWNSDTGKHDLYGVSITTYNFSVVLSGYFLAPETGTYTVRMTADDAAAVQFGDGSNCSQELSSSVLKCGITQEVRSGYQNGGWGVKTQSLKFVKDRYYPVRIIWWQKAAWVEFIFNMTTPSGKIIPGFENSIVQLTALGSSCPGATCIPVSSSARSTTRSTTSSTSSSRSSIRSASITSKPSTTTPSPTSISTSSSKSTLTDSSRTVTSLISNSATSTILPGVSSSSSSLSMLSSKMRPVSSYSLDVKSSSTSSTLIISTPTRPGSSIVEPATNSSTHINSKSNDGSTVTSSFFVSSVFASTTPNSFSRTITRSNSSSSLLYLTSSTVSSGPKPTYPNATRSSTTDVTLECTSSSCIIPTSSLITSVTNQVSISSSRPSNSILSNSETCRESCSASVLTSDTAESSATGAPNGTSNSQSGDFSTLMSTTTEASSTLCVPSVTYPENDEKSSNSFKPTCTSIITESNGVSASCETSSNSKGGDASTIMPTTTALSSTICAPSANISENSEECGSAAKPNPTSAVCDSNSASAAISSNGEHGVTSSNVPTKTSAPVTSCASSESIHTGSAIIPTISVSSIPPTNNARTITKQTINILIGLIVVLLV